MEKIKRSELIENLVAEFAIFSLEMLSSANQAIAELDGRDKNLFLADLSCFASDMLFAFKSHVDFETFSVPIIIDLLKNPRSGIATFKIFNDLREDYVDILELMRKNQRDFIPQNLIEVLLKKRTESVENPIFKIVSFAIKKTTTVMEEENEQH
jgi:hypothetical protein